MRKSILISVILVLSLAVLLLVTAFYYQYYLEGRVAVISRNFIVYSILLIIFVAIVLSLVLTNKLLFIAKQDSVVKSQHYQNEKLWELNQIIRTQRHDFVNHLQTVYGLIQLGMPEEAEAFISELYDEVRASGEVMRLAMPELSALLLAKTGFAARHNVAFKMEVESDLSGLGIRPFDLVTMAGNLINNALEAVQNLPPAERKVQFSVFENSRFFIIQTHNPGFIPPDLRTSIFTPGFSTKKGNTHRGLGLASIRQLTDTYKGFTVVSSHPGRGIRFTIGLPKQKERPVI